MNFAAIPKPQDQRIPSGRNGFKALALVALLGASFALTVYIVNALGRLALAPWLAAVLTWSFVAALAVWHGVLITGMAILAHDAVHRVLFRSPFWNELGGGLLSAMAWLPFYAHRQLHLTHHGCAHQPGLDPENEMHDHAFLFAVSAGSLVALYLPYRVLFQNLWRIADARYRDRVWRDLVFLAAAGAIYFALVPALGMSPRYTVVPMLLALPPVFAWRALSDHYGIPAIERGVDRGPVPELDAEAWHRDRVRRRREVTGWVVLTHPWLEWLWSHANYHEVHHKYPWLSHIHLKSVFEATRISRPYLVVQGYWRSLRHLRSLHYYESRDNVQKFLTTPEWRGARLKQAMPERSCRDV